MNPLQRIAIPTALGLATALMLGIAFRKQAAPPFPAPIPGASVTPESAIPSPPSTDTPADDLIARTLAAKPDDPAATDLQRAAFTALQRRLSQPVEERLRENIAEDPASYRARSVANGGAALRNPAHAVIANFERNGAVEIAPSNGADWRWQMEALDLPAAAPLAIDGPRLERSRGPAITEWYVNEKRGLEQFFTLAEPIARDDAGESRIRLAMKSDLKAYLAADDHLVFRDAEGNEVLHYHGLAVFDAEGTPLPARMELESNQAGGAPVVALVFDTGGAAFPVTVDPFVSTVLHRFDYNNGANPDDFIAVTGSTFLFAADDGINGEELWKSDGTAAGTVMLKDIYPGSSSSSPQSFTIAGSMVYFSAQDDIAGRELWKTDLTEGGTVRITDIYPGKVGGVSKFQEAFQILGGRILFLAEDDTKGLELWSSNGTGAGTGMVKDINPDGGHSSPSHFAHFNGELFFRADDGTTGYELWKTDGSDVGTVRIADIRAGTISSYPTQLTSFNGSLYFQAQDANGSELWKSDGQVGGTTEQVKDIQSGSYGSSPDKLFVFDGSLFFRANDGTHGTEIWKTDGTEMGTVLFKEINAGTDGSDPREFVIDGTRFFFRATDAAHGAELWKSDGTEGGTVLVADILPGSESSYPTDLFVSSSTLYFSADDGATGKELWMSAGTAGATIRVRDIDPRFEPDGTPNGGNPGKFFSAGGTVFFAAADENGTELWKTDGTEAGTARVRDIDRTGDLKEGPLLSGDRIFFVYESEDDGEDLWVSDGTAAGTGMLRPEGPDDSLDPEELTDVGGTLFFEAYDGAKGEELWKSNGTAAGTVVVKDIKPGENGSYPDQLTAVGNLLFFSATTENYDRELWKSDGTEAGTVMVKDIRPNNSGSYPEQLTALNGLLLFLADDGVSGDELWKSDGTEDGTVMVVELQSGDLNADIQHLTAVPGLDLCFFTFNDEGADGNELWKSDGTEAGTMLVKDIEPGAGGSDPSQLTDAGSVLYFEAFTTAEGRELWISDGETSGGATGTNLVSDIAPGPADSHISQLTTFVPQELTDEGGMGDPPAPVGGPIIKVLAFLADDGTHGRELWIASPNEAVLFLDLAPGSASGFTSDASIIYRDRLHFAGNDGSGTVGTELYSPPTMEVPGVPVLHEDLIPGSEGSNPIGLIDLNGQLIWFAADDLGRYTLRSDVLRTPTPVPVKSPDLTIGKKPGSQKGDNVYNASGAGQKLTLVSRNLKKLKFHGRMENESTIADPMSLSGSKGNKHFKVKYFGPTGNVTGEVIRSGYTLTISPATFQSYRIEFKPSRKLKNGTTGRISKKRKTVLVKLSSGLTTQIDGIKASGKAR